MNVFPNLARGLAGGRSVAVPFQWASVRVSMLRIVLAVWAVFQLCQCASGSKPQVVPVMKPGTLEGQGCTPKLAPPPPRPSHVLAALERVMDRIETDVAKGRGPVGVFFSGLNKDVPRQFSLAGPSGRAVRKDGRKIMVLLPMIVLHVPGLPEAEVAKVMPEVQGYCRKMLSMEFIPVERSELQAQRSQ
jgi:hypothetical protein